MKTIKSFARVWPERKAKPTQRQRELAAEIQKKLGLEVELPEDAKAYRQFINNHIRQRGKTNVDSVNGDS